MVGLNKTPVQINTDCLPMPSLITHSSLCFCAVRLSYILFSLRTTVREGTACFTRATENSFCLWGWTLKMGSNGLCSALCCRCVYCRSWLTKEWRWIKWDHETEEQKKWSWISHILEMNRSLQECQFSSEAFPGSAPEPPHRNCRGTPINFQIELHFQEVVKWNDVLWLTWPTHKLEIATRKPPCILCAY